MTVQAIHANLLGLLAHPGLPGNQDGAPAECKATVAALGIPTVRAAADRDAAVAALRVAAVRAAEEAEPAVAAPARQKVVLRTILDPQNGACTHLRGRLCVFGVRQVFGPPRLSRRTREPRGETGVALNAPQ